MSTDNFYKIGNLHILTPADWLDVTNKLKEPDPPLTLARPNGLGAIQVSVAEYEDGKAAKINLSDLGNLLEDFAQTSELGSGYDLTAEENPLLISAASFDFKDRFLRVWYCSNGQSVIFVTYNCHKGYHHAEIPDCEKIVRNLRFTSHIEGAVGNSTGR
jgi:hypothetical protein